MSLLTTIDEQIAIAMRQKIVSRVAVLRLLKNSLKNEQIKLGHELTEPEEVKVLQREAKQRRDSVEAYQKGDRPELAASEEAEFEVIAEFLPSQLSDDELADLVQSVMTEINATSPSEMGVVIGAVMQRAAGKADGATVSRIVRQKLV